MPVLLAPTPSAEGIDVVDNASAFEVMDVASIKTEDREQDEDYPEGGFGWWVVVASFAINFFTLGLTSTFGVYQSHFLAVHAFHNASDTSISWVGPIASGCVFLPGPFIEPLMAIFGLKPLVLIGILACSTAFILASFAHELWELHMTQGFMFGIGAGLCYLSTISLASQYFDKKRGLANGISVAGAGIGTLIMAPLTHVLIAKVGIPWCQRIVGLCLFGCLLAVFPLIRPRVKPMRPTPMGSSISGLEYGASVRRPFFDWNLLIIPGFGWLCLFAFTMAFGKRRLSRFCVQTSEANAGGCINSSDVSVPLIYLSFACCYIRVLGPCVYDSSLQSIPPQPAPWHWSRLAQSLRRRQCHLQSPRRPHL